MKVFVFLPVGSSCARWVQCCCHRRLPLPQAAAGSGWRREAAGPAASGRTFLWGPTLPWRDLQDQQEAPAHFVSTYTPFYSVTLQLELPNFCNPDAVTDGHCPIYNSLPSFNLDYFDHIFLIHNHRNEKSKAKWMKLDFLWHLLIKLYIAAPVLPRSSCVTKQKRYHKIRTALCSNPSLPQCLP